MFRGADGAGLQETVGEVVGRTLSLLVAPSMLPLLLLFFYTGFSNGCWSGVLTQQMETYLIGYMMVVVGVGNYSIITGPRFLTFQQKV